MLETVDKEQHKKDVRRRKLTSKQSSIFSNTSLRNSFKQESSPSPSPKVKSGKKRLAKKPSQKRVSINNSSNVYNFNLIVQPGQGLPPQSTMVSPQFTDDVFKAAKVPKPSKGGKTTNASQHMMPETLFPQADIYNHSMAPRLPRQESDAASSFMSILKDHQQAMGSPDTSIRLDSRHSFHLKPNPAMEPAPERNSFTASFNQGSGHSNAGTDNFSVIEEDKNWFGCETPSNFDQNGQKIGKTFRKRKGAGSLSRKSVGTNSNLSSTIIRPIICNSGTLGRERKESSFGLMPGGFINILNTNGSGYVPQPMTSFDGSQMGHHKESRSSFHQDLGSFSRMSIPLIRQPPTPTETEIGRAAQAINSKFLELQKSKSN